MYIGQALAGVLVLVLSSIALGVPFACVGMLRGIRTGNNRMVDWSVALIVILTLIALLTAIGIMPIAGGA